MSDFAEIKKNKKTQEEIISTESVINTNTNANHILINQEKHMENIDAEDSMDSVDISELYMGDDIISAEDEHYVTLRALRSNLRERKRSDMAETVLKALNPVWKLLGEPMKKQDALATKRYAGIFLSRMDILLEKCSVYLASKHTRSSVSKKNYTEIQNIFKIASEIRQSFYARYKEGLEEGDEFFDSLDETETYTSFYAEVLKDNTLDADKSEENTAALTIASFLGLDHEQVTYSNVDGENKRAAGNIERLGKFADEKLKFQTTEESYNQIVKFQILGILTGNKYDIKDIYASYTRPKDNKNSVFVEKITGLDKPLEFTDNTDLDIDIIEFKRLDARIIDKLKTMRDNNSFINNLDISDEAKEALKIRLSALLRKIDINTSAEGYQKEETHDLKKYNKSLGWSYMGSKAIIKMDNIQDFVSDAQRYRVMEADFEPEKISAMQLRSGFVGNVGKKKKERATRPNGVKKFFSKMWHWAAYGVGAVASVFKKAYQGIGYLTATQGALDQEEFIEDRVPGLLSTNMDRIDMQALEKHIADNGDNQEVIDDTRLVPLAYQKMIPVNVEEPPYIRVLVSQPKPGTEATVDVWKKEVGHTMLEIEYTKVDSKDGTKKRFKSRFGFYPKGGSGIIDTASMTTNATIMPGTIDDDNDKSYDVGRRFEATNKQINELILFTQRYAKGGYNLLSRSCSTFVAEALQHIKLDDKGLLQKNRAGLAGAESLLAIDTAIPFSATLELLATPIVNRKQGKKIEKSSYQRIGQRQITRQEYKRFFESKNDEMMQYTPGFLGENLRQYDSKDEDESILSFKNGYIERTEKQNVAEIIDSKNDFMNLLEKDYADRMDRSIITDIDKNLSIFIGKIDSLGGDKRIDYDNVGNALFEKARLEKRAGLLYQMIKYVSKVYNVALDRDEAASKTIQTLISSIENMITYSVNILNDYRLDINTTTKFNIMTKKSLANEQVVALNTYKLVEDEKYYVRSLSTLELVGWLEICGDINTVVEKKKRYEELKEKQERYEAKKKELEDNEKASKKELKSLKLTSSEEDEYFELRTMYNTVMLFENTHRDYLMRDKLTYDFAKMAFNTLPKVTSKVFFPGGGEKYGIEQFLEGPAQTYQNVAFAKIFAGIMPDKANFNPDDMKDYIKDFDDAADKVIEKRKEEFFNILHAKFFANPDIHKADYCDDMMSSIISTFLRAELAEQFNDKIVEDDINVDDVNKYFEQQFRAQNASITKIMRRVEKYYDDVRNVYLEWKYSVDDVLKFHGVGNFLKDDRKEIKKILMKAIREREDNRKPTDKNGKLEYADALDFASKIIEPWEIEVADRYKKNITAKKSNKKAPAIVQQEKAPVEKEIIFEEDAVEITKINLNTLKKTEPAPANEPKKAQEVKVEEPKVEVPKKAEKAEKKGEPKVEKPKKIVEEAEDISTTSVKKKEPKVEAPKKKAEIKQTVTKLIEEKNDSPKKAIINPAINIPKPKLASPKPSGLGFFSKHLQSSYRKRVHDNYYVEHNNKGIPKKLILTSDKTEVEEAIINADTYGFNDTQKAYLDYRLVKLEKLKKLSENKQNVKPRKPRTIKENGHVGVMLDVHQRSFQCHGNSCWSAVMENMMRYRGVDIDQDDIRMFRPDNLKEYYENGLYWQGQQMIERDYLFKDEPGNIFDMGDLVVDTMKNVAVSRAVFPAPKVGIWNKTSKIRDAAEQFEKLFLHILKELNSPIAILMGNHYRTIIGVCGDRYYYKNSLPEGFFRNYEDDPDETHIGSIRELVRSLVSSWNGSMELTWLEDINVDENGQSKEMEERYKNGAANQLVFNAANNAYTGSNEVNMNDFDMALLAPDRKLLIKGVAGEFKLPANVNLTAYHRSVYMPKKLEP